MVPKVSYQTGYDLMMEAARIWLESQLRGRRHMAEVYHSFRFGDTKGISDNNPVMRTTADPFFKNAVESAEESWRRVCATALLNGIPVPAITSALGYYDGFRSERLPANLLQAQRDYFGAHQYERLDSPRGKYFHTDWTGRGGSTASTTYDV